MSDNDETTQSVRTRGTSDGVRARSVETDDTAGHHFSFGAVPEPETDDTEGHGFHGAVPEPETDDTAGHHFSFGAVPEPETDDTEGHGFRIV